jgi:hypothetical protein
MLYIHISIRLNSRQLNQVATSNRAEYQHNAMCVITMFLKNAKCERTVRFAISLLHTVAVYLLLVSCRCCRCVLIYHNVPSPVGATGVTQHK